MEKIKVPISKANRLINSGNLILVTSSYKGKSNIITVAWHMPVSIKPPIIGVSIGTSRYSAELIKKGKEFIVNIPTWNLLDKVLYCGTHSGRDVDKFEKAKLTQQKPLRLSNTPKIGECIGAIECTLIDYKELGDHIVFFGEVLYVEAVKVLFKNEIWDPLKAELIYHLGGDVFMCSTGRVDKGEIKN
ncbi:MAG: flavin reductase family protein [candidate division WOR-3 bacterium]